MKGVASLGLENIDVKSLAMDVDGSKLQLSGKMAHVYSWFTNNGTLNGELQK